RWGGQQENPVHLDVFFRLLAAFSLVAPFKNLVSHAAWYGPAVLAIIALWPRICARARALGPGCVAYLLAAVALAVDPESRTLMAPVLVSQARDGTPSTA